MRSIQAASHSPHPSAPPDSAGLRGARTERRCAGVVDVAAVASGEMNDDPLAASSCLTAHALTPLLETSSAKLSAETSSTHRSTIHDERGPADVEGVPCGDDDVKTTVAKGVPRDTPILRRGNSASCQTGVLIARLTPIEPRSLLGCRPSENRVRGRAASPTARPLTLTQAAASSYSVSS